MRSHMAVLRKIAEQGLDPKKAYVVSKDKFVPKVQPVLVPKILEIDSTPVKKASKPEPAKAVEVVLPQVVNVEPETIVEEVKIEEETKIEEQPVVEQTQELISVEEKSVVDQALEAAVQVEEKPKKSPFKKKMDQKI